MKIIVVSGFLGNGKTTFIESFSKRLENLAILENDYARANIDSQYLSNDDNEVFSLEEGCICCSKQADFATTVLTISNGIKPDYLIIEPTGVGYLSKVISNLKAVEYEQIKLLNPITIVDFHTIDKTLEDYGDLFIDQIKNAGHILLSKIENVEKGEIDKAISKLSKYTDAKIYNKHYSQFTDSEWNILLDEYDYSNLDLSEAQNLEMDNFLYEGVYFDDFQSLGTVLNAISDGRFGKIIRGKGVIRVEDKYVKVDIVQGSFELVKYEGPKFEKLVFIGENLEKNAFDILFKPKDLKIKSEKPKFTSAKK